jgi:hypothetical protein
METNEGIITKIHENGPKSMNKHPNKRPHVVCKKRDIKYKQL